MVALSSEQANNGWQLLVGIHLPGSESLCHFSNLSSTSGCIMAVH